MSAPGIRWSSVEWRDMPPPEKTWVMLKSEGFEGDEQISSGFVSNGRSWGLTVYDGSPEASLNDHAPLSIFIGWAPITVTPLLMPDKTSLARCPFCGDSGWLRELSQWSALSSGDPDNTATLVEHQCHSPTCNGRSFWV